MSINRRGPQVAQKPPLLRLRETSPPPAHHQLTTSPAPGQHQGQQGGGAECVRLSDKCPRFRQLRPIPTLLNDCLSVCLSVCLSLSLSLCLSLSLSRVSPPDPPSHVFAQSILNLGVNTISEPSIRDPLLLHMKRRFLICEKDSLPAIHVDAIEINCELMHLTTDGAHLSNLTSSFRLPGDLYLAGPLLERTASVIYLDEESY